VVGRFDFLGGQVALFSVTCGSDVASHMEKSDVVVTWQVRW